MSKNKNIQDLIKTCQINFPSYRLIKLERPKTPHPVLSPSNEYFNEMKPYSRIKKRYLHNHQKTIVDEGPVIRVVPRGRQVKNKGKEEVGRYQETCDVFHYNQFIPIIERNKSKGRNWRNRRTLSLSHSRKDCRMNPLNKRFCDTVNLQITSFSNEFVQKELSNSLNKSIKAKTSITSSIRKQSKNSGMSKGLKLLIGRNKCKNRKISQQCLNKESLQSQRGWETVAVESQDWSMFASKK